MTASTCSLVTPGNHDKKSSIEAPPSMFSNSATTGTRVSRKTHEPLTFSGSRSTAGHEDQSIIGRTISPQLDKGKNHLRARKRSRPPEWIEPKRGLVWHNSPFVGVRAWPRELAF